MDSVDPTPSASLVTCCDDCECQAGAWIHLIKKNNNNIELIVPGFEISNLARVEIGNECDALREMVTRQQKIIQNLSLELEKERSASSSAANETMSMMLRLQKEKAEIQLEFCQFKRYVEEKIAHDQQQLSAMEDLVYNREIAIESLYAELQSYRLRMRSYGFADFEVDGEEGGANNAYFGLSSEMKALNYPFLRCNLDETFANVEVDNGVIDIDKYAFGDTPKSRNHLKDVEHRPNQLEKTPRSNLPDEDFPSLDNVWEKVNLGQSHHQPLHNREISTDSRKSFVTTVGENGSDLSTWFVDSQNGELRKRFKFNGSEIGDDLSEKECTIDIVDQDIISTPKGSLNLIDIEGLEIKELTVRLHALEADRESMRKTLNAMQTDKAQVVLLKEIALHLCKDIPQARRVPPERKPTIFRCFSFLSAFTLMASFVFWRTKPRQAKYMFGISARNVGLLMLIDKGPRVGRWRRLFSTQI